ncbi:MAG: hypothetical protein AAFV07_20255, partial [Bacteroidota bacterium]
MPRLILSRKGFDSSNGGIPSPVIRDQFYSLPIPQKKTGIRYVDLNFEGIRTGQLLADLKAKVKNRDETHLDPDLKEDTVKTRPKNWQPVFGQHGAALKHLLNEGVGPGDLFLFFGWFRAAEQMENGSWRFLPGSPSFHA